MRSQETATRDGSSRIKLVLAMRPDGGGCVKALRGGAGLTMNWPVTLRIKLGWATWSCATAGKLKHTITPTRREENDSERPRVLIGSRIDFVDLSARPRVWFNAFCRGAYGSWPLVLVQQ